MAKDIFKILDESVLEAEQKAEQEETNIRKKQKQIATLQDEIDAHRRAMQEAQVGKTELLKVKEKLA